MRRFRDFVISIALAGMALAAAAQLPPAPAIGQSVWETNFGTVYLQQEGNLITGTYSYAGGRIIAALDGQVLSGYWWENDDPTGCGPDRAWCGPFVFTIAPDGQSFSGYYDKASRGVTTVAGIQGQYAWTGRLQNGGIIRKR